MIDSALRPDLLRLLTDSPGEFFESYDLTEEQRDILRNPDNRLLRVLGEALARMNPGAGPTAAAPRPHAVMQAQTLPDMNLALTVVPCAQLEDGQFKGFSYAVWVNPLAEGTDPASLPPPAGATLPGQPLAPLHAVIRLSAVQFADAAGHAQVGLWASLRQDTNVDSAPEPGADESPGVALAAAAVRAASSEERYDRLIDLIRVMRNG